MRKEDQRIGGGRPRAVDRSVCGLCSPRFEPGEPQEVRALLRGVPARPGSDEQRPPAFEPGRRVLDRREIREQPLELRRLPLDRLGHLARHQPEGDSLPSTSFPAACTWRVSRVNQMPGPPLSCTTLPVSASVP